ncbi:MAG: DNA adenine methylase, partial [Bradyrhizobium sp.]
PWKLDARFNREELISRIKKIYSYRDRIKVYQMDAPKFLSTVEPKLSHRGLIYLDPPYYRKGPSLYLNYYKPQDHKAVAARVARLNVPWVVSYDNVPEVTALYADYRQLVYALSYSALARSEGSELMVFSEHLRIPDLRSPVSVGKRSRTKDSAGTGRAAA